MRAIAAEAGVDAALIVHFFGNKRALLAEAAPPHTVGLHHRTVVLPDAGGVDSVRRRLDTAGIAAEPAPGGLRVRDPWQTAVDFVSGDAIGGGPQ